MTQLYIDGLREILDANALKAWLRNKIEEADRERAAQEIAHAQSSDWNTPASSRVIRIEGQISAFKAVLAELEKE